MVTASSSPDYLTTQRVAKELGLSEARVRQLANKGDLPAIRTDGGIRLFARADVEHLRRQRARAKGAA
jgi:excisionase family DNA binding protein